MIKIGAIAAIKTQLRIAKPTAIAIQATDAENAEGNSGPERLDAVNFFARYAFGSQYFMNGDELIVNRDVARRDSDSDEFDKEQKEDDNQSHPPVASTINDAIAKGKANDEEKEVAEESGDAKRTATRRGGCEHNEKSFRICKCVNRWSQKTYQIQEKCGFRQGNLVVCVFFRNFVAQMKGPLLKSFACALMCLIAGACGIHHPSGGEEPDKPEEKTKARIDILWERDTVFFYMENIELPVYATYVEADSLHELSAEQYYCALVADMQAAGELESVLKQYYSRLVMPRMKEGMDRFPAGKKWVAMAAYVSAKGQVLSKVYSLEFESK